MHEYLGMLDGGGLSEHWIDVLVATFIAALGYFISDRLRSIDSRFSRTEDKFEKTDEEIGEIKSRVSVVEDRCGVKVENRKS